MREERPEMGRASPGERERRENADQRKEPEGRDVLQDAGKLHPPRVQPRNRRRQREPQCQARGEDGPSGDFIQRSRVESGDHAGEQVTDRGRLPRADDRVGEHHGPRRGEGDGRGKDALGVCDLAAGIRKARDESAVRPRDRQKKHSPEEKAERGAAGSAPFEPVVHEDDPADADHGPEAEGEVLDERQGPVETGRRRLGRRHGMQSDLVGDTSGRV